MNNSERKKQLAMEYKQQKPEMGIFLFENIKSGRCYIGCAQNLKGALNGGRFKLNSGNHPNKVLQQDWNTHGEEAFHISVLETMPYEEDESKTDYKPDLELLAEIWKEKYPHAETY